jgi:hypothetical protein
VTVKRECRLLLNAALSILVASSCRASSYCAIGKLQAHDALADELDVSAFDSVT